jgi:aspartate racemase
MKTIGLIGGTSWVSTIDYYRLINKEVNKRRGGNESAKIILHSVNYGEIVTLTQQGDWKGIAAIMCAAAKNLEMSGADCVLLCANTMHRIAKEVQAAITIPLIHIADVTAKAIQQQKATAVLLLGTQYTMQGEFYPERLNQYGIGLFVPDEEETAYINNSIYNELGKDIFLPATKERYIAIINKYKAKGAAGVILGCTEIPLLLQQQDCSVPVFDTLQLHAIAAVDFATAI